MGFAKSETTFIANNFVKNLRTVNDTNSFEEIYVVITQHKEYRGSEWKYQQEKSIRNDLTLLCRQKYVAKQ